MPDAMHKNGILDSRVSAGAAAWKLQLNEDTYVAVGQLELIHVVEQPDLFTLPLAPEYCNQLVIWNSKPVPVFDLDCWIRGSTNYVMTKNSHSEKSHQPVIVIARYYSEHDGTVQYGALKIASIPAHLHVKNSQHTDMTNINNKLKKITITCFNDEAQNSVAILNLRPIFSSNLN